MGGRSSKKKSKEDAPAAPLEVLIEGAIVFLKSKASGKLLRVHEGSVDALGEEGESAQFTVCKKESESGHVVTLQNGDKYLSVTEEAVELSEETSELKVVEAEEGCVSFESVKTEGRYLFVQEDGSVQSGTELGPPTHFTVASAVKKEEPPPAAEAAAPASTTEEPAQQQQEEETTAEPEKEEPKTEEEEEGGEQKESEEPQQEEEQAVENKEEQAASES